jgi:glycosyltransferase involved in cell wall biosynthesis
MREAFYHRIDLLAVTSIAEGTPNPVLEAMACGVPVVSTPVGHVPELIVHGKNGWIVNSINHFAEIFRWLAEHPEEIEKRRNVVIDTAKKWSWEYRVKDWQIAINETLRRMKKL